MEVTRTSLRAARDDSPIPKQVSKRQKAVKDFLKDYWYHHVTFEEFPVVGTRLSLDFYNANKRVAVEVQGAQHTKYNKFFFLLLLSYCVFSTIRIF